MFRKSLFVIVCLAIPCLVFADTIYLKNGKQIKDVEAVEDGDSVKYQKFGTEISIPKQNVDRIEKIAVEPVVRPKKASDMTPEELESYRTPADKERRRKMDEIMEKVDAIKKK